MMKPRYFALLPAAGESQRMGFDKLLAVVAGRPLISFTCEALRSAGCIEEIYVVVSRATPELAEVVRSLQACPIVLREPTVDMRQTVEEGLHWLEAHRDLQADDALFIAPADCVRLSPQATLRLALSYEMEPGCLWVCLRNGRPRHPLLLPWRLREAVYALPQGVGLNCLWQRLDAATVRRLELGQFVDELKEDIDTPEDLDIFRRSVERS
jgi:CTP:molybdopterin cytidylyltransferase MocA